MFNLKKNVFALILIISFVLFLASSPFIQAQVERELEVEYPEVDRWRPETIEQAVLPQYIKYIFTFSVAIAGLVAFGALIYGGFRYITSAGAPTAQKEAKDQIFAGVIGLAILLSSYLILTTINPQLVLLKPPELLRIKMTNVPGVYLSTETTFPSDEKIVEDKKMVYHLTSSIDNLRDMIDGKINSLKIVNQSIIKKGEEELKKTPDFYYGVILYERINQEGTCSYFRSLDSPEKTSKLLRVKPNSITVFQEVEETKKGTVTVYTREGKGGEESELTVTTGEDETGEVDVFQSLGDFSQKVWSIKIDGDYLLVLKGTNARGKLVCTSFDSSVSNLHGYLINQCRFGDARDDEHWWSYKPCATEYALFPIY